jgi:predicted HicB family RNase H-like nuclease
MKSINVKIPLSIASSMDDRGELNPAWLTQFIEIYQDRELPNEPIKEFTFNYTFKINEALHKKLKLQAIDKDLPMNEYIGRLLVTYY